MNPDPPATGGRVLARGQCREKYALRLAAGPEDIRAAQALRFEVFNLELREGLAASYATRLDADPFDAVCDHLLVEEGVTRAVVGTYRLQSGLTAAARLGYYSEQEFVFAPFEPMRAQVIELGRACVHRDHRNLSVLALLWKGIATYARERGGRYLIGCSSLTSQDPGDGAALYAELQRRHLALPGLRTVPQPAYVCGLGHPTEPAPKIPRLLLAYLSFGATICGPPAIDREFKTIDFLTLMDLAALSPDIVARYLT
ncbi:MAG: GNAT family N-acyltransferase [Limisphaerales bacterium]